MKMKVYVLAQDIHNTGASIQVFGSEHELLQEMEVVVREGVDMRAGPEVNAIKEELLRGSFRGAFELFANGPTTMTSPKPANDEYRAEEHEITVPCPKGFVPYAQELRQALLWALAAIKGIPDHEQHVLCEAFEKAQEILDRSRPEPPTLEEALALIAEGVGPHFDGEWAEKAKNLLARSGKATL